MDEAEKKSAGKPPASPQDARPADPREARLAEALRANLKRRKAQDRARKAPGGDGA